ncbi:SGNH/GDSL hydrolase family protein [Streptomyces monticola]|uniref:SGNH/GDSL hydrolase family protein n=1 Tax=Streptomyces monticola TaxID=2666263 RepID=A0ABW2JFU0_9ACTN
MPIRARSRVGGLAAVATAVAATAALGTAAPAHAAATDPAGAEPPLRYVALGDSYSAGSGNVPLDPSAPLACLRSTVNYPHVIAGRTAAQLTDVTCGGAQTGHFTKSQYPGVAPQLDAVTADTELVTLTIGGNDNNTFISAILACGSAGLLSLGKGNPCEKAHGDSFKRQIDDSTYPAVRESLRAIRAKAPNARVAILGYPWILPPKADPACFAKMPVAEGDVPYLRDLQAHLNRAVQRAAGETGATYVDMAPVSEGRDACKPAGTRWVEPVFFASSLAVAHPNAAGEAAMATQTLDTLGTLG